SNAAELLEGILPESLPHLYRDAACFVRKLGVRYLWIDALCIIQTGDGLADWRHESTLMDKVYSHAFCNLSALSGLDSSHSLFYRRDVDSCRPPLIHYTFGRQTNPSYLVDANFWEEEVRRAHFNTRVWVFQELLLSRRVVSFGERQVFWSCRSGRAAEIWPPDIPVKDPYEGPRIENL
ncbi:heterokaryon incompatibility protein, partial [Colletotrichum melonis]